MKPTVKLSTKILLMILIFMCLIFSLLLSGCNSYSKTMHLFSSPSELISSDVLKNIVYEYEEQKYHYKHPESDITSNTEIKSLTLPFDRYYMFYGASSVL